MDNREWIEKVLESLPFVKWDRFIAKLAFKEIIVYGWIDRDKDAYKDFIVLKMNTHRKTVSYVTSTVEWHGAIEQRLFRRSNPPKCVRVEEYFKVENSIKLNHE